VSYGKGKEKEKEKGKECAMAKAKKASFELVTSSVILAF